MPCRVIVVAAVSWTQNFDSAAQCLSCKNYMYKLAPCACPVFPSLSFIISPLPLSLSLTLFEVGDK